MVLNSLSMESGKVRPLDQVCRKAVAEGVHAGLFDNTRGLHCLSKSLLKSCGIDVETHDCP